MYRSMNGFGVQTSGRKSVKMIVQRFVSVERKEQLMEHLCCLSNEYTCDEDVVKKIFFSYKS